jgi:hypothetical protein
LPGDYYRFFNTGDRLWLASQKNLYSYDGSSWKNFSSLPAPASTLQEVARSKDGSLWFFFILAESQAIFRYDGQIWKHYGNLDFTDEVITTSDGVVWFISSDLLVSFDGHNLAPLVLPGNYFRYYVQNSLLRDDGSLWLQTDQGTFIIQGQHATKVEFPGFGITREGAVSPIWIDH